MESKNPINQSFSQRDAHTKITKTKICTTVESKNPINQSFLQRDAHAKITKTKPYIVTFVLVGYNL